MAKKTKAPKSAVHEHAAIQEARKIWADLYCLKFKVETDLGLIVQAQAGLQEAGQAISRLASRLRDLLEATKHGSPSPQRERAVPAGRNNVDGVMPPRPRPHPSKPKMGNFERISAIPARQVCTCVGTCRGPKGLGKGWVCALETKPH